MATTFRHVARAVIATLAGALLLVASAKSVDVPIPPKARVVDNAGLLTTEQRIDLDAYLAEDEAANGPQIAVLTVATTAPETIDEYGIRVADAWHVGRKGIDDGVILIIAKDNPRDLRRLRLEVGRGLEGALPDTAARRILDEEVAPRFREQDYYGGIFAGVQRVESLLAGEPLPPPSSDAAADEPRFIRILDTASGYFTRLTFVVVGSMWALILIRLFFAKRWLAHVAGHPQKKGTFGAFFTAAMSATPSRSSGDGGSSSSFDSSSSGSSGFDSGGGDFGGGGASSDW